MDSKKIETDARLVETKVKVKPAASRKQIEALQQLIYIGPPISKGGATLRTNQTFIGGFPTHCNALYEEYPLIKQLFVPVAQMRESIKKMNTPGTALNVAVQALKGV